MTQSWEEREKNGLEKIARLHDALESHGYIGHDLEVYLVRLLFCFFADNMGIFFNTSFLSYIKNTEEDGSDLSEKILSLFEALNKSDKVQIEHIFSSSELERFRHINRGLFEKQLLKVNFNEEMRKILLECCYFDWSKISPAIFGALFQGVTDKEQRRKLGIHYTNKKNILKLINPLFMDDLWKEFEKVQDNIRLLDRLHDKISKLKFLDPACGCGNFLIITYCELKQLEIEILKTKLNNQLILDISHLFKVNVGQFYGIEYDDFACQITQLGMWIIDYQMNACAAEQFNIYCSVLPSVQNTTIIHGNALKIDWENIIPKQDLSFILGNPPFIGYNSQSVQQKNDIISIYRDRNNKQLKNSGRIDYVAGWYYKASEYMAGTQIRAAFVSTNSIVQGEQVAFVWKPLFDMFDMHIDFGYRTFAWNNNVGGNAQVHCVIIGFSCGNNTKVKIIFDDDKKIVAKNINPYLIDAPDVFVKSRKEPLHNTPKMVYGNKPVDGGFLLIEADEYEDFITKEPEAKKYIKKIYGSVEYINNIERYCLWLVDVPLSELEKMPLVMQRVEQVRQFRLSSLKKVTQKHANTPMLFQEIRQKNCDYMIIPQVSSERRKYIPFGFVSADIIANNAVQIIDNATIYHFGVLMSSTHQAWIRVVCGRLKSDYRYAHNLVYNNFPWPNPTSKQKVIIEKAAQSILDVRSLFPKSTLAKLYDPLTMPPALLKAHEKLDKAVYRAYNANWKSEAECVADLMQMYQELTNDGK